MNIISHKGVFFPDNIKTPHQEFKVGSDIHKKFMRETLQTLVDFHEFAENNNILYSISGGSLMGYFWNKDIMPWDDDIDIMLGEKDYFWVKEKLWSRGSHIDSPRRSWKWPGLNNWRKTSICGKTYLLTVNNKTYTKPTEGVWCQHLFKIINITISTNKKMVGGLDVGLCKRLKDGKHKEFWTRNRSCCGPTDNFNEELCPLVSFAGITTRAIVRNIAEPHLNEIYGKNWVIPSHPTIKHLYNAEDYVQIW